MIVRKENADSLDLNAEKENTGLCRVLWSPKRALTRFTKHGAYDSSEWVAAPGESRVVESMDSLPPGSLSLLSLTVQSRSWYCTIMHTTSAAPSASCFSPLGSLGGRPRGRKRLGAITVETFHKVILLCCSWAATFLRNSRSA